MQKQFYFLSPVEVMKVTPHNLEEVAEWCGGVIDASENPRFPSRLDKFVNVPVPKGTTINKAYPNMYITKRLVAHALTSELRVTFAVFRRDYFEKNYFKSQEEATKSTWGKDRKLEKLKEELETSNVMLTKALHASVPTPAVMSKKASAMTFSEARDASLSAAPDVPEETFRSAETGQYVTEEFAEANPDTTVKETTDEEIDAIHGKGAADALNAALADGAIFND